MLSHFQLPFVGARSCRQDFVCVLSANGETTGFSRERDVTRQVRRLERMRSVCAADLIVLLSYLKCWVLSTIDCG